MQSKLNKDFLLFFLNCECVQEARGNKNVMAIDRPEAKHQYSVLVQYFCCKRRLDHCNL
jgi:hypothetical protein